MALTKENKPINGTGIKHLWSKIKSMFVKKSGDTMTGALSFQDTENANNHIILDGKAVEHELVYKTFGHGIHLWGQGGTSEYVKKINLQLPDVGGLEKIIMLPSENGTLITREQTDNNYLKRQPEATDSDDNYMGECSVRPSTWNGNHMLLNLKGAGGGSECQIKVSDDNGPKLDIRYGYNSEPNGDFLRMASVNDLNDYLPSQNPSIGGNVEVQGTIYVNGQSREEVATKNDLSGLLAYPVGSIYMSVNSTSPASLFGGSWYQLKDRFLLGAGSSYSNGSTGGAATVTLTESQIPSHWHSVNIGYIKGGDNELTAFLDASGGRATGGWWSSHSIGGGQSHNNMPPYLVVYMWKRTA